MARVHVEGLLTLSDGSGQWEVRLHHPFLVVAVDNRLRWHGQRVTLGHVLGQGSEGLLGLEEGDNTAIRSLCQTFCAASCVTEFTSSVSLDNL